MKLPGEPVVFRNGEWIPQSQASIGLNDFGFLQGATITDLLRTFHGQPYLAIDHIRRFLQTGEQSQILPAGTIDEAALGQVVQSIVQHNHPLAPDGSELAVVLIGTPGVADHYLQSPGILLAPGPTLIVHSFPIQRSRYASWFQNGARLRLVEYRQVPDKCVPVRWKTRNRLNWWLAERQARQWEPGSLALIQNLEGDILETALAHVVIVKNGDLFSPPAGDVLQGISLAKLRVLAKRLGLGWREKALKPGDLGAADEILLTGTMFCVAGVSRFEGQAIEWPGPVLVRLQELWWGEIGQNLSDWFVKNL